MVNQVKPHGFRAVADNYGLAVSSSLDFERESYTSHLKSGVLYAFRVLADHNVPGVVTEAVVHDSVSVTLTFQYDSVSDFDPDALAEQYTAVKHVQTTHTPEETTTTLKLSPYYWTA